MQTITDKLTKSIIRHCRYQVFHLGPHCADKRELLGSFRNETHAWILLRSLQDSDPGGNYWIADNGDMPPGV